MPVALGSQWAVLSVVGSFGSQPWAGPPEGPDGGEVALGVDPALQSGPVRPVICWLGIWVPSIPGLPYSQSSGLGPDAESP